MPGGADSNGSGVAAVMELARLFSGLYASARTQGRANMLFLLTSGGNFNFLGAEVRAPAHIHMQTSPSHVCRPNCRSGSRPPSPRCSSPSPLCCALTPLPHPALCTCTRPRRKPTALLPPSSPPSRTWLPTMTLNCRWCTRRYAKHHAHHHHSVVTLDDAAFAWSAARSTLRIPPHHGSTSDLP